MAIDNSTPESRRDILEGAQALAARNHASRYATDEKYRAWYDELASDYEAAFAVGNLDFSMALTALKSGKRVRRSGWNGKGMWLILVPGTPGASLREGSPYYAAGLRTVDIAPHIDMFTAQGTMQPGWLASQTDMLADDWEVVTDGAIEEVADSFGMRLTKLTDGMVLKVGPPMAYFEVVEPANRNNPLGTRIRYAYEVIRGLGASQQEAEDEFFKNFSAQMPAETKALIWRVPPERRQVRDFATDSIVHQVYARAAFLQDAADAERIMEPT